MNAEGIGEPVKLLADGLSYGILFGTLVKLLPSLAALLTVAWLLIRIWESDTVRGLTKRPLTGRRDE